MILVRDTGIEPVTSSDRPRGVQGRPDQLFRRGPEGNLVPRVPSRCDASVPTQPGARTGLGRVSPGAWLVHRASERAPGPAVLGSQARGGRSTVALYRRRPARAPRSSAARRTYPSVVSVCLRRPDLRVNDAQPGRAAGADTGIAPSAPRRLRRGHQGHRGLIPLPVGLGRVRHPYRLGRAVLSCGSRAAVRAVRRLPTFCPHLPTKMPV